MDVEHEVGYISQFPLESVEVSSEEIVFNLGLRHTACLALEKCLPPAKPASELNPAKFNFQAPPESAGGCSTKPQPK